MAKKKLIDSVEVEVETMPTALEIAESREIAAPPAKEVAGMDTLLEMAVRKDFDIDRLKELIALKNGEEDREARKVFDHNYALMQREIEPVARTKKGAKSMYTPLEDLIAAYGPIINKYGFGYRWSSENLENGDIRVTFILSGHGYTTHTPVDIPPMEGIKTREGKSVVNAVQVYGGRKTYGRRYSMLDGLGLSTFEADADDMDSGSDPLVDEAVNAILSAASHSELDKAFKHYYVAAQGEWQKKRLIDAKQKRFSQLR